MAQKNVTEVPSTLSQAFEYESLGYKEIRLVEILPGSEDDQIRLSLRHASLDDLPEYSSFSYAWGDEQATIPVTVNGKEFLIRPNLNSALLELRARPVYGLSHRLYKYADHYTKYSQLLPETSNLTDMDDLLASAHIMDAQSERLITSEELAAHRERLEFLLEQIKKTWNSLASPTGIPAILDTSLIWIDALCINQDKSSERAEQVQIMRDVYKRSVHLIVWLGTADHRSDQIIEVLRSFEIRVFLEDEPRNDWFLKTVPEKWWTIFWEDLISFCTRPWFQRCWILQEYVLGGSASMTSKDSTTFCCGRARSSDFVRSGREVLVTTLLNTYRYPQIDHEVAAYTDAFRYFGCLKDLRRHYRRSAVEEKSASISPGMNMLQMMLVAERSRASDPRDKIYGIMGLVSQHQNPESLQFDMKELVVDYEAPLRMVYASFVKACVSASKQLDILLLCHKLADSSWQQWADLPSWAPHWESDKGAFNTTRTMLVGDTDSIFASAGSTECEAYFSTDLSILTVTGMVWDEVLEVFEIVDVAAQNGHKLMVTWILNVWQSCYKNSDGNYQEFLGKFIATMLFNPASSNEDFSAWTPLFEEFLTGGTSDDDFLTKPRSWLDPESKTVLTPSLKEMMWAGLRANNLFMTKSGYVGKCSRATPPGVTNQGILVCVLLGCPMPILLKQEGDHFSCYGEVYSPGIMHGEAMASVEDGSKKLQIFELH